MYHVSAHHSEWEDIRENVLNYDEEGGGEQDQVNIHIYVSSIEHLIRFNKSGEHRFYGNVFTLFFQTRIL